MESVLAGNFVGGHGRVHPRTVVELLANDPFAVLEIHPRDDHKNTGAQLQKEVGKRMDEMTAAFHQDSQSPQPAMEEAVRKVSDSVVAARACLNLDAYTVGELKAVTLSF